MGTHRTPWTQPHFPEGFLSTSAASQSGIGQAGLRWGQADLHWGQPAWAEVQKLQGSSSADGVDGAGETISGPGGPEGPA